MNKLEMVELIPITMQSNFYSSFYHWYKREKPGDIKVAIQKASDNAGIDLDDAHGLIKFINGRTTEGLAYTGDRAIVNFFRVNWEKFAQESEKLLQAA